MSAARKILIPALSILLSNPLADSYDFESYYSADPSRAAFVACDDQS